MRKTSGKLKGVGMQKKKERKSNIEKIMILTDGSL